MARKKRRTYNTLGRRILSVLDTGERKENVLIGFAASLGHGEKFLLRTLERLCTAGLLVRHDRGRNGITYDLAERTT